MKSDNEPIEEFLKGIVLPEYKSDGHARQLRAQILSGLQARRAGSGIASWWKTAALLLGLLGAAALAAEVVIQVHHYYFFGRVKDGPYVFSTAPKERATNDGPVICIMVNAESNLDAAGIEQQRKDLEEIDALRQRNARQLFYVTDTEVNGKPSGRIFFYKYVFADGRTRIFTETGSESLTPAQMESDRRQIADLRQRGQREIQNVVEVESGGRIQRSLICHYVLSDGRGVIRSEPDPELPGPVQLTTKQGMELERLAFLEKKGKFLGSTQVQVLGRTFSLQKYSFTLSDGTVVTRSEGQQKCDLTAAEADEFHQLSAANKGETLGTYEEDVMGKPVKFTRVKYVLSNGTEVIQSIGKPGSGR